MRPDPSAGVKVFFAVDDRGPAGRAVKTGGRFKAGFTFVEVLVAVTLILILSGSLYAVYASAVRMQKKAQTVQRLTGATAAAFDTLALDLENMVPYHQGPLSQEEPADFFLGQSGRLRLLRRTDMGLKEVRYYLQEPDYGFVHKIVVGESSASRVSGILVRMEEGRRQLLLVREERPFPAKDGEDSAGGEGTEVLVRSVEPDSLKFSYSAVKKGVQEETVWTTDWAENMPPSLVRVEITFSVLENSNDTVTLRRTFFVPLGAWK